MPLYNLIRGGDIVVLRCDSKNVSNGSAEQNLLSRFRQWNKCDLGEFLEVATDWLNTEKMGNSMYYWNSYKLVLIDSETLQLVHTDSEGNPDRYVCNIVQFREAEPYSNPLDLL